MPGGIQRCRNSLDVAHAGVIRRCVEVLVGAEPSIMQFRYQKAAACWRKAESTHFCREALDAVPESP
jgi:hypothetical protein